MAKITKPKTAEDQQTVDTIQDDTLVNETENNVSVDQEKENKQQIDDKTLDEADAATSIETDPLAIMTAERDALKDQLLRALAETENMRRRSEREAQTAREYGHTQFARDLVNAIDNLDRALASAPQDKSTLDESVRSLITGIELSWTEIQNAIEKHGVRQINPVGEKFDYNFHQAMFEVASDDHPPGVVIEVLQHGYALHDRLLRPAMVGVSKELDPADTTKSVG